MSLACHIRKFIALLSYISTIFLQIQIKTSYENVIYIEYPMREYRVTDKKAQNFILLEESQHPSTLNQGNPQNVFSFVAYNYTLTIFFIQKRNLFKNGFHMIVKTNCLRYRIYSITIYLKYVLWKSASYNYIQYDKLGTTFYEIK